MLGLKTIKMECARSNPRCQLWFNRVSTAFIKSFLLIYLCCASMLSRCIARTTLIHTSVNSTHVSSNESHKINTNQITFERKNIFNLFCDLWAQLHSLFLAEEKHEKGYYVEIVVHSCTYQYHQLFDCEYTRELE